MRLNVFEDETPTVTDQISDLIFATVERDRFRDGRVGGETEGDVIKI